MRRPTLTRIVTMGVVCASYALHAQNQQSIGSVGIADATVSGALEVTNGRAQLLGASTVTARDRTAEVALNRGGSVRVCATSGLHLNAGKGAIDAPIMLALDRGAIELAIRATTSDVVMTPDLRFTLKSPGPLDLRLRVARNGDTCVENRGAAAPALSVADQFGESSYELHPGQHVLFEHGSLKEVVDNEHEPCGCPPEPVVSVADAGVTGATPAAPGSIVASEPPKAAAEQHPFPAALSAGLAPASAPPQAPAGTVHAQVSTTMSYGTGGASDGTGSDTATTEAATAPAPGKSTVTLAPSTARTVSAPNQEPPTSTATTRAQAPPPAPAPPPADVFHSIGRFFKKLFGSH
jgi:hypothetical protein